MALTKIDDRGLKTPIDLLDNEKIRFGTGNDLDIYHNPSNGGNIIDAATSQNIWIKNNAGSANEAMAAFRANGSSELYYDGSKKFETDTNGVTITGITTCNGDVHFDGNTAGRDALWDRSDNCLLFQDDAYLKIGTGADLQLYHDGNHSYILNTTGDLKIKDASAMKLLTNSLRLKNADDDGTYIAADDNGAVELYHSNSKKFETTSAGVKVAGTVQVGSNSAPSLLESSTGGGGSEDIFRVGLNRTNASTSDRQIWSEYTVSSSLAKFAIYARTANDTGTAGLKFSVDAVAGTVSDSKGDLRNIPRNNQTSQYTLVVGDAGKVVGVTSGGWVIPANVFTTVGQVVTLLNRSTSDQTVNASALTYLWNTADGANIKASTLTLGAQSMATIWFEGGDTGYIQASNLTVS